jgi:cobalt-zinc-cadmium efflux system membrane fusion protein
MKLPLILLPAFLCLGTALAAPDAVTGVTEPQKSIELSFPESGVIRAVAVKEGDAVKEGQVLAHLDCRVLEAQLKIAKMKAESPAGVKSATATLEMRQHKLDQLKKLAASQNANADELARAKAEHEIAQADLLLANEAVAAHAIEAQQIEAQIEQRTLRAPFDGVVARIVRDTGASVTPNDGPLISVVKLDRLDLVVHVDHRQSDGLTPGTKLSVEAVDRPVSGTGTIEFVSPVTDPSSGTVRVRIALPNEQGQHRGGVKYRVVLPNAAVAAAPEKGE